MSTARDECTVECWTTNERNESSRRQSSTHLTPIIIRVHTGLSFYVYTDWSTWWNWNPTVHLLSNAWQLHSDSYQLLTARSITLYTLYVTGQNFTSWCLDQWQTFLVVLQKKEKILLSKEISKPRKPGNISVRPPGLNWSIQVKTQHLGWILSPKSKKKKVEYSWTRVKSPGLRAFSFQFLHHHETSDEVLASPCFLRSNPFSRAHQNIAFLRNWSVLLDFLRSPTPH